MFRVLYQPPFVPSMRAHSLVLADVLFEQRVQRGGGHADVVALEHRLAAARIDDDDDAAMA